MSRFNRVRTPPSPFPLPESAKPDLSPVYYWNNKTNTHTLFILDELNVNLIEYDLGRQEIINTYPAPIDTTSHPCTFIDDNAKLIYVLDDDDCTIFDIRRGTWSVSFPHQFSLSPEDRYGFSSMVYLPIVNRMYVIAESGHYKIESVMHNPERLLVKSLKYSISSISDIHYGYRGKVIYIGSKLMLFPEFWRTILVCDVTMANEDEFNWIESDIKLPNETPHCKLFEVINGWDQLIFLFNHESEKLHCLDLLHLNLGWIELNGYFEDVSNFCSPEIYQ